MYPLSRFRKHPGRGRSGGFGRRKNFPYFGRRKNRSLDLKEVVDFLSMEEGNRVKMVLRSDREGVMRPGRGPGFHLRLDRRPEALLREFKRSRSNLRNRIHVQRNPDQCQLRRDPRGPAGKRGPRRIIHRAQFGAGNHGKHLQGPGGPRPPGHAGRLCGYRPGKGRLPLCDRRPPGLRRSGAADALPGRRGQRPGSQRRRRSFKPGHPLPHRRPPPRGAGSSGAGLQGTPGNQGGPDHLAHLPPRPPSGSHAHGGPYRHLPADRKRGRTQTPPGDHSEDQTGRVRVDRAHGVGRKRRGRISSRISIFS